MSDNPNSRRRVVLVLLVLVTALAFVLTVYASTRITKEVKENFFQTGDIKINLNDGKAVIQPEEYTFEPGMTVVKPFFIRNEGTGDFYYKIYFRDIEGSLGNHLEISICNEQGAVLFSGKMADMTRSAVQTADDILPPGKIRNLTISFHLPEGTGNGGFDSQVQFILCADAVQAKNNPNKEF